MYMNFQQNRTITVGAGAQTHKQTDRQTDATDQHTWQKSKIFCQVTNGGNQHTCQKKNFFFDK